MKKIHAVLDAVLVCALLICGCIGQNMHRSYTNATYGFSLDPPVGWQSVENGSVDEAVRFTPANQSNVSFVFAVPFSLSEGRALSTFADEVEENLSASGMNYTITYRDWRTMDGAKAYEIVYSYEQGSTIIRVKQVAVLKTRTAYLVTFTAPYDLYIQYINAVDRCIDSFT